MTDPTFHKEEFSLVKPDELYRALLPIIGRHMGMLRMIGGNANDFKADFIPAEDCAELANIVEDFFPRPTLRTFEDVVANKSKIITVVGNLPNQNPIPFESVEGDRFQSQNAPAKAVFPYIMLGIEGLLGIEHTKDYVLRRKLDSNNPLGVSFLAGLPHRDDPDTYEFIGLTNSTNRSGASTHFTDMKAVQEKLQSMDENGIAIKLLHSGTFDLTNLHNLGFHESDGGRTVMVDERRSTEEGLAAYRRVLKDEDCTIPVELGPTTMVFFANANPELFHWVDAGMVQGLSEEELRTVLGSGSISI